MMCAMSVLAASFKFAGEGKQKAWHDAGKPAELHIFIKGAHGFGMNHQDLPSDSWIDLFKNWLGALGYLSPPAK